MEKQRNGNALTDNETVHIDIGEGEPGNFELKENGHTTISSGRKGELLTEEVKCDTDKNKTNTSGVSDLQYTVDDNPPWYLCLFLGFQHYLTMFGSTLSIPMIVAPALCMGDDNVAKSELLGTILFVSGFVTILQSTIGTRLPIIQGGTFAFLVPTFAILKLEKWQCPPPFPEATVVNTSHLEVATTPSMTGTSQTTPWDSTYMPPLGSPEHRELWQSRIREIQGAIIVASLFQVLIGFSGLTGLFLRFIGPLAIAPTIALIGISLFPAAADFCSSHWWIALLTILLITVFSQYLRNVDVPCVGIKCVGEKRGFKKIGYPIFKLFPVILAICMTWLLCVILTVSGALPEDPKAWGYKVRTDTKLDVINQANWFRFPYPLQWGVPTFSVGAVLGMFAGVLAGMIESVGDYYACARLAGAPTPPVHAINRGIFVEGVGCVLAGLWGTGTGTTSYSENIGAIGITKVGSRRVVQFGGAFIMLFGMLGKFGAIFVTIPDPIIGGVFMVMFGMIAAVGISNLQFVDLNSSRNLFIFGFSVVFGLALPNWISRNHGAIQTGSEIFDQILTVLLSTSMFVGGAVGFIFDNTIPGTREERGLTAWSQKTAVAEDGKSSSSTYDLPFGMSLIRKWSWTRYIPWCPTFNVKCNCSSRGLTDLNKTADSKHEREDQNQVPLDEQSKVRKRQNEPYSTTF